MKKITTLDEKEQEILLLEKKIQSLKNEYQKEFDSFCKENADNPKSHIQILKKNIKELYKNNNNTQEVARMISNNIDFGSIFGASSFGPILEFDDYIIKWFEENISQYNITATPTFRFKYQDSKVKFESQSETEERRSKDNFDLLKQIVSKTEKVKSEKDYECTNYTYRLSLVKDIDLNDKKSVEDIIDSLIRSSLKYYMKESLVIRNSCVAKIGSTFTLQINGKFF